MCRCKYARRSRWHHRQWSADRHERSEYGAREEKSRFELAYVLVTRIVEPLEGIAPTAEREVYDTPGAERDGDMCDVAVRAIGKKQQVASARSQQIPARIATRARLLPSVSRQIDAVKREHA